MDLSALEVNETLLIQLGLFFISFGFLNNFFFKPYISLLEARKAKTSGLKEKSVQDRAEAERLRESYENFMKAERQKLAQWVDGERKKITDEERFVVQKARTEASEQLKASRAKLAQEGQKARKELGPLVGEYASQIATRLVGRKVKVAGLSLDNGNRELHAETTV